MYLDVFQAEQDYAAYLCELDERAAELKFVHMLKSEGTLSKWILGRDVSSIPEAVSLIAIVTNAAYRIRIRYGQNCAEREQAVLGILAKTQPRIWCDMYERITYTGAELLEFILANYQDMHFHQCIEAELTEFFELCAAIEERIVDILIAEAYEDD